MLGAPNTTRTKAEFVGVHEVEMLFLASVLSAPNNEGCQAEITTAQPFLQYLQAAAQATKRAQRGIH